VGREAAGRQPAVGGNNGEWHERLVRVKVADVAQQSVAAEAVSAAVIGSGMPFTAPLNAGVRRPEVWMEFNYE
jgi:hypothetical protein